MTSTARQYNATTLEGATHLGLLLATYDVLAEDIRLAGNAATAGDIVQRCALSSHAALLLGHLESWVPLLENPALEASLIQFYTFVRSELMRLQATSAKQGFDVLALNVCETRAAWQQHGNSAHTMHSVELPNTHALSPEVIDATLEVRRSWSA